MNTVGTCGKCGGPVQSPEFWGGTEPPPQKCARCGATPVGEFGPVIPMRPEKTGNPFPGIYPDRAK